MATKRSAADAPGDCERLSKKAAVQSSATATQVPSSSGEWKLAPTGTLSSIDRAGAARAPSLRPTNAPRNGAAVPHAPHAAAAQTAATSSAAPTAAKSSVTPTATTLPAATLFATPTVTTLTAATPTVTTLTVVPTAGLFGASSTAAATVLASSSSTATMSASSSSTASLPQSHPIVKGLYYIPNYITGTTARQCALVSALDMVSISRLSVCVDRDGARANGRGAQSSCVEQGSVASHTGTLPPLADGVLRGGWGGCVCPNGGEQQYGYKYSYKTKGLAKLPASQKFPSTCQVSPPSEHPDSRVVCDHRGRSCECRR